MTEVIENKRTAISFRPTFYFLMTLSMAFFIFGGFSLTYWVPIANGALPPTPPIVHIHGFVFFSWMILLVIQAFLVNIKNVRLHRSLGTFGIAVGSALIIVGSLITFLSLSESATYPPDSFGLTYLSFMAIISFTVLFTLAIRNVRSPEKHKRLILFATIALLPPGINRLYMVLLELSSVPFLATYMTMNALILAILVKDWRTLGKVSNTAIFGASFIIISELLFLPITGSTAFAGFNDFLNGLVYYR